MLAVGALLASAAHGSEIQGAGKKFFDLSAARSGKALIPGSNVAKKQHSGNFHSLKGYVLTREAGGKPIAAPRAVRMANVPEEGIQLASLDTGALTISPERVHVRREALSDDDGYHWPIAAEVAQRISSPFGWRRHPITKRRAFHAGVDIAAAWGTKVLASRKGVISEVGAHRRLGRYVKITHSDGSYALYGHMQRSEVRQGQRVKAGAVIGRVGSTGRSTGPHLDFSIRIGGRPIDPMTKVSMPTTRAIAAKKSLRERLEERQREMPAVKPAQDPMDKLAVLSGSASHSAINNVIHSLVAVQ